MTSSAHIKTVTVIMSRWVVHTLAAMVTSRLFVVVLASIGLIAHVVPVVHNWIIYIVSIFLFNRRKIELSKLTINALIRFNGKLCKSGFITRPLAIMVVT